MVNTQLLDYIKQQLAQGLSKETIRQSLTSSGGWNPSDVEEAFSFIENNRTTPINPGILSVKKKSHKGLILAIVIVVLVLAAGVYYYINNPDVLRMSAFKSNVPEKTVSTDTNNVLSDSTLVGSDLLVSYEKIPESENSATIWNSIASSSISKPDQDFITKYYFGNYSSTNTPPLASSLSLIKKYQSVLNIFDSLVQKKYQCSDVMGDICPLSQMRYVSGLAALKASTLFEQNKLADARSRAEDIVSVGKQITSNSDSLLTTLVGWFVQKIGYGILTTIHNKQGGSFLTLDNKNQLISNLRQEQKRVFEFMYTRQIEAIDYITSSANVPIEKNLVDDESVVNDYRKAAAASPTAWNPTETKKYFYNSYKIALSNIDRPCGALLATSTINVEFNPKNTTDGNFVGKTLYSTVYASLDSAIQKRCEIEGLINSLYSPAAEFKATTTTTGTLTDPWTTIDKLNTALENSDIAGYNSVSYKTVPSNMAAQFTKMTSFLYSQSSNLNESDFVNKWQDDKQAIYSTIPKKDDTVDSYGYTQSLVFFIKGQDDLWKVLSVNPQKGWYVSKKGTNETAVQVEQDLQKMMLDSDKDGVDDMDEICGGAEQYNSKCVKTDPNKRDTNGNGLWDGVEAEMKS